MTTLKQPDKSLVCAPRRQQTPVAMLVLRRQRPGFDPKWGQQVESATRTALSQMGLIPVEPPAGVVDDLTLRAALEHFANAACDVAVVLQPTMGDLRLVPTIAQQWPGGIVFWATPERPDGEKVSSCSLVGAHGAAALLRQLGRPFEIAWGDPAHADTRQRLAAAIRVAQAAARLKRSKIGLVGEHAPGFIDMQVDPAALHRQLGVHLHQIALTEFIDRVRAWPAAEAADDVRTVKAMELPCGDITDDELAIDSRYYLAMRGLMREQNLDALAVRCWPELPNIFGQWPYLAMSRLTTEGRVVALEGDADGALTGLLLSLLGLGPGYISDWLEHASRTITLWHPGHAPCWMTESPALGRHFNNDFPLVVNAELRPGLAITICRIWRCDGQYRMTAAQAHTRRPIRKLLGTHGVAELTDRDAEQWFEDLCHAGMPHHITLVEGHHQKLLQRCARHLNLQWGP